MKVAAASGTMALPYPLNRITRAAPGYSARLRTLPRTIPLGSPSTSGCVPGSTGRNLPSRHPSQSAPDQKPLCGSADLLSRLPGPRGCSSARSGILVRPCGRVSLVSAIQSGSNHAPSHPSHTLPPPCANSPCSPRRCSSLSPENPPLVSATL